MKLPSLQSHADVTTNTGFFAYVISQKNDANFREKTCRTLFDTLKQNCMRNLERSWQSSLLSKKPNALFPPKPSITLIEKKGKDRSFLENWRPISLVNFNAKIMSKVLATRVKNVLPDIIHHNQSGFVKDCYIGETVWSIFDLMDFTLEENIPGLMIFIDFHKAFDSVE